MSEYGHRFYSGGAQEAALPPFLRPETGDLRGENLAGMVPFKGKIS